MDTTASITDVEAMKLRAKEMETEAAKLTEMQAKLEEQLVEGQEDVDARSVHVGNVDYGATPEELKAHFQACGTISRVTIICDRYTGHPKGYAYIEFADVSAVPNAMILNESLFRDRVLTVTVKRTNIPGFRRGRGGRGGGRYATRGGFRGRGRGGRSRGAPRRGFTPY